MKTTRGNKMSHGNIKKYSDYARHGHADVVREKRFSQDTGIGVDIVAVCVERKLLNSIQLISGMNGPQRETYLKVDLKMEKLLDYFCIHKIFAWQQERSGRYHSGNPGELFSVNAFESFLQTIARAEKDEPGVSLTELSIFLGCSDMQLRGFMRQGLLNAIELDGARKKNERYSFYKIKPDDNLRALLLSVGALDPEEKISDIDLVKKIISIAIAKGMPSIQLPDAA